MKCALFILRHKWYVLLACIKLGVPLWRALVHDLSKFSWAELPHYQRQFFGDRNDPKGFAKARLHHRKRNDHHWEHFIVESIHSDNPDRDGCIVNNCLSMPFVCVTEMIADWIGAGKVYPGSQPMAEWLPKNLPQMQLHPKTLQRIQERLRRLEYDS